jgi:hypothetical protein
MNANQIEVKATYLNSGFSKIYTVWINGQETSCWSAVSANAALKRRLSQLEAEAAGLKGKA